MTISNRYVVATLYSVDNVNPVAGMDAYKASRLDWAENTHDSVPGDCYH